MRAFISFRDEDRLSCFDVNGGILSNRVDRIVRSGPVPMVSSADGRYLFIGLRKSNELICLDVSGDSEFPEIARASLPSDPCFLSMDGTGRFIFSSYYKAGQIAVHEWDCASRTLREVQRITTLPKAHSIRADRSNMHVYVPHTGPNRIYQFMFDSRKGELSPMDPPWVSADIRLYPRHLAFNYGRNLVYCVDEGSCTLSTYGYDPETGRLSFLDACSTLPEEGFEGCKSAEIRMTGDGRFVYVSNRFHDSIACFRIDPDSGLPRRFDIVGSPKTPRVFELTPDGRFMFVAGQDSGELWTYGIDGDGGLTKVREQWLGLTPMWIALI